MVREGDDFAYEVYSPYYENNVDAGFDMFDRIPGVQFLDTEDRADSFELFYENFVENGHDREAFFEYMGMEPRDFPWEEWREWMGYD
jgi:hypothetical protein